MKTTGLRLFLVLAILVSALGHRDAALAHVADGALAAAHHIHAAAAAATADADHDDHADDAGEATPAPADHPGHVPHHHSPAAMREADASLLGDYRRATGRHALPTDMAALPSRTVAPLPEPPTA